MFLNQQSGSNEMLFAEEYSPYMPPCYFPIKEKTLRGFRDYIPTCADTSPLRIIRVGGNTSRFVIIAWKVEGTTCECLSPENTIHLLLRSLGISLLPRNEPLITLSRNSPVYVSFFETCRFIFLSLYFLSAPHIHM